MWQSWVKLKSVLVQSLFFIHNRSEVLRTTSSGLINLQNSEIDHQFIIKEYNAGTARWETHRARCGKGLGSSHSLSDMPLSTKHLHLFTTLAGPSLGVFVEAYYLGY